MKKYMLDTNIVSHAIKLQPKVLEHLTNIPMQHTYISSITYMEITYGLVKRTQVHKLKLLVEAFLRNVTILPFNQNVSEKCSLFKFTLESQGKNLVPLDLLIAGHAYAEQCVFTNDQAFYQIPLLQCEDWTI